MSKNVIASLGPALVEAFDAKTIALLIEAANDHAATLAKLDSRTGDGSLGEEAEKLSKAAAVLRSINQIRSTLAQS